VQGAGCRVQGSGFRVQGAGFRVQGSGVHRRARGVAGRGGSALPARNGHGVARDVPGSFGVGVWCLVFGVCRGLRVEG